MKHRFKSLNGAVRRVRTLERIMKDYEILTKRLSDERKTLAKLAAKDPIFFNPLEAMAAEELRDKILTQMGCKS